ncbi:MAG: ImmA/IrrE family metallo-endopeptidase [Acutalibacteraceae bacterium]|nr:ImmA/IrrE family metallo-endopeptidase [Acutalibacteraceae bacterium]
MERIQVYVMSVKFDEAKMLAMEEIVKAFFEKNNIEVIIPVDIFAVASSLGFDVRGAEFKEPLEGLLLVDENIERIKEFNSNKIIAYNCQKNIYMKKFIVAHELSHYISEKTKNKDKKIVLAARDHEGEYSNNTAEQEMDYMAASILMPREDLLKNFSGKNTERAELINLIASRYNVSVKMAERRIEEVLNG